MASIDKKPRPGRRFLALGAFIVIIFALVGGGAVWSNATWSPKLALDLEGGTSIILEPQLEDQQVTREQLQQAVAIIRQRVDSTGVSEAEISTQGDRNIVVNLPGNPDEETRNLVRSSAQLAFRRVALVGAPTPIDQQQKEESEEDKAPELSEEDQKKLDDLLGGQKNGPQEPANPGSTKIRPVAQPAPPQEGEQPQQKPEEEQKKEEPKKEEPSKLPEDFEPGSQDDVPRFKPEDQQSWMDSKLLEEYAKLDCTKPENRVGGDSGPRDEPMVSCDQTGEAKYILGPVELAGSHVKDASFGFESTSQGTQTNRLAVSMEFDDFGRDVFGKVTSAVTGAQPPYNQFAIVLDGLVLSAPVSQSAVTDGRAQITGSFSEEEASTLANQLKNGALPISFKVQSEQQISPTLGADYLKVGLITGGIGLLLVVVYSLLQYRVLGLVTVSSLVVAGVLTWGLLLFVSWRYGYRLSLAGVAGIIIGIGMAADSFIVYFERVRDELREGRKLLSAVEVGWDRARRTIYASKAVNMLAAVILFILAVGSVRGFAFTLGLTVIVDIVIVVLFTHPMLQVLARTRFFGEGHPMSGMDPRQLGVKAEAYRGAMGLDLEKARKKSTGRSHKEAKRRDESRARKSGPTLAERKAAERKASSVDTKTKTTEEDA
ncbi:protein translocase subunit SecD [Brevibacterium paucivorans]